MTGAGAGPTAPGRGPAGGGSLRLWLALLAAVGLLTFATSGVGPFGISYENILRVWLSPFFHDAASGVGDSERYIVVHIRLARACLALMVGASLGLAGAVYQGVLLNPLADPFTLGISAGGALGASLAILFGWGGVHFAGMSGLPVAAFAGSMGALYLVYMLGRVDGKVHSTTLVLAGIMVSTFLSAWISLLKSLHEDSVSTIVFWIMGSLSGKGWLHTLLIAPYLLAGSATILAYARELDCMSLGEVQAMQLGVDVPRIRLTLLVAASLITAAAVAVSGVIGFIGLVVPHIVRLCIGPGHRRLLPLSLLLGGVLLLISDTLARSILPGGQELPVGVLTAILGGPFFCHLLLRRKKNIQL
ncbi:MAG: FecCD family ABC transporter permease [Syntrophobacteraceae bacterium]